MVDVDDFKQHNDTRGHLAGDDVLREVAVVLRSGVRDTDVVGRYGREEFMIIAAGSDKNQVTVLAERIRKRIEEDPPVTVSIGIAGCPVDGLTAEELIYAADSAMYEAKREGKNCVRLNSLARRPQQTISAGTPRMIRPLREPRVARS